MSTTATDRSLTSDATELVGAVKRGDISCTELVDSHIDHIAVTNPAVNAIVTVDPQGARERAGTLEHELALGCPRPLHGLPITIKDTITTAGLRTTAGSEEFANHTPTDDAPVVARLRRAGAVILGKTNVPKLAGDLQTHNALFGETANPWDHTRTPGGSSGGAAAAVAAGMSTADIGSDHAGSLSLPAHYCGVYAHKPTFGTVPSAGHIPPRPGVRRPRDLTVIGPIARSARDLVILLEAIASTRQGARVSSLSLIEDDPSLREFRLAAWIDDPYLTLDTEVADILHATLDELVGAGVHIDAHARPNISLEQASRLGLQLLAAEAAVGYSPQRFSGVIEFAEDLPPDPPESVNLMARGLAMRHRDWLTLDEQRWKVIEEFDKFFAAYDALIAPVSPITAPPRNSTASRLGTIEVNGETRSHFDQITWPAVPAMAYLPATTVPVGISRSGLPVGLQVIGPRYGDRTTLSVARLIEAKCDGYRPPHLDPCLSGDADITGHRGNDSPEQRSAPDLATGGTQPQEESHL